MDERPETPERRRRRRPPSPASPAMLADRAASPELPLTMTASAVLGLASSSASAEGGSATATTATTTTTTPALRLLAAGAAASEFSPAADARVVVRFKAVGGSAPQLRRDARRVGAAQRFEAVVAHLRRALRLRDGDGLFLYVNSAFAPALDEVVGNLHRVSCHSLPPPSNSSNSSNSSKSPSLGFSSSSRFFSSSFLFFRLAEEGGGKGRRGGLSVFELDNLLSLCLPARMPTYQPREERERERERRRGREEGPKGEREVGILLTMQIVFQGLERSVDRRLFNNTCVRMKKRDSLIVRWSYYMRTGRIIQTDHVISPRTPDDAGCYRVTSSFPICSLS